MNWITQMGIRDYDMRIAAAWQISTGQTLVNEDGSMFHRIPSGNLEGYVLQRRWNPAFKSSIEKDRMQGLMPFKDNFGNVFTLPPSHPRAKKLTPMED